MHENTRSLVSRALANDRDAVETLFQRYRERLRSALRKLVGPKYRLLLADSDDATQDAILSALRRLGQFEYRGDGSFLAWLLKGAEFEILRRVRALETRKRSGQQRDVELDTQMVRMLPGDDKTPAELVSEQEMAERVRAALTRLPDREREVIMLRRYLELDNEEICNELGLPTAGAVRALLSRAQARLSDMLADDEDA
ncbi:MAG: RNA polymerase sigma factor [Planctomycetota bacterium]